MSDTISVSVTNDMRLFLTPTEVARGGEHNSATFKIIQQPVSLEPLACRAEVQTAEGSTYRLVENGEFALTNDISVPGPGSLQLVYSDGTNVTRKTSIASFTVARSLNAVNESDPTFQDGLAQLQAAAFARVVGNNDGITFYNLPGQPVGNVIYPPAQGGGDLTEERANGLYLRLSGLTPMQGSVGINGPNRGITWEDSGRQGALYSTGTQLVLRLPEGDPPFVIEPNSGAAGLRSPVLTQQAGDTRYLLQAGGQMSGPLITATGSGPTNPGLGVGDNATGFYRAGQTLLLAVSGTMYQQWLASPPSLMMTVPLNMAVQPIQNLADARDGAPGAMDAVNRRTMDAAIAVVPGPNSRTYLTNTVDLTASAQILSDQLFPVANNSPRTVTVTIFPTFSGGTPSQFYDLIYECSIAPLIQARSTVYPTAAAYMYSPVRFAATVTPVGNAIQVQVTVRLNALGTGTLTITGSGTDKRSYITIEEQQN